MQHHITKNDLTNIGVLVDGSELEKLLGDLNSKVDDLIGNEILTSLSPDDVEVLAHMSESASEEEIGQWISEHVPDYEEIIEDNRDIVLGDYAETIDLKNEATD